MGLAAVELVVGGGSIGQRHIKNLNELGINVAAVDPDPEAREEIATTFNIDVFSELSEGLDKSDPDFVVVCTPNRFHVEVAIEAAEAGCHLLIEKPLSHEMEGIAALKSTTSRQNLVSLVGCNLRFQPELREIRRLLQKNSIGSVAAARIEAGSYLPEWFPNSDYTNSYSAKEDLGGGVILDYIHEIHYARWFFGEFDTISALAGQKTELNIETNDIAGILAETSDGTICEFHLDYIQREYSRSCHIIGEKGTIRWSWDKERVDWYIADEDEHHSFERPDGWSINDMYIEEMKHFISCIEENEQTVCPIECGQKDIAVALAARESVAAERHVSPATLIE